MDEIWMFYLLFVGFIMCILVACFFCGPDFVRNRTQSRNRKRNVRNRYVNQNRAPRYDQNSKVYLDNDMPSGYKTVMSSSYGFIGTNVHHVDHVYVVNESSTRNLDSFVNGDCRDDGNTGGGDNVGDSHGVDTGFDSVEADDYLCNDGVDDGCDAGFDSVGDDDYLCNDGDTGGCYDSGGGDTGGCDSGGGFDSGGGDD